MQVAIIRTTIDRKTGQRLSEEIIGYEEVDEDAYYRPLVEIFGKRVLEALQNDKQEGGLVES
ncbi:MAG TPA: hypothetical protein GXX36_10550 [Clostridiaceae bacterium]|nr:hypothetical protein [Clostridiaceae bacterium]